MIRPSKVGRPRPTVTLPKIFWDKKLSKNQFLSMTKIILVIP